MRAILSNAAATRSHRFNASGDLKLSKESDAKIQAAKDDPDSDHNLQGSPLDDLYGRRKDAAERMGRAKARGDKYSAEAIEEKQTRIDDWIQKTERKERLERVLNKPKH